MSKVVKISKKKTTTLNGQKRNATRLGVERAKEDPRKSARIDEYFKARVFSFCFNWKSQLHVSLSLIQVFKPRLGDMIELGERFCMDPIRTELS